MFTVFRSEKTKLRQAAQNWLYVASKVTHFRKDQLKEEEVATLMTLRDELRLRLRESPADMGKLKVAIDNLESHLRVVGGAFYPRSAMGENVEFFFVALIIYLGFTAFFIKPFKIPTNSMWPTYHGMTGQVWSEEAQAPGAIARTARFLAFGARRYELKAPADGELLMRVTSNRAYPDVVDRRRYFVLPGKGYRYVFSVGGVEASVTTPTDFSMDNQVLLPGLFPGAKRMDEQIKVLMDAHGYDTMQRARGRTDSGSVENVFVYMVKTGKYYKKGDTILSFDILTGDQLFVDRMSYHFARPKVGDGFVFRTGNIPGLGGEDQFYIKRLVGTPGDRLQILGTALLVNGEPATGSKAFAANADETPPYRGYAGIGNLGSGQKVTVPENAYYTLGDNSYNSQDSRYWGFAPERDVVGKPLVIYYPFTKRFGLAK